MSNQNGSIFDAFMLWKQNVEKKFEGLEDCSICYSVIHFSTYSLPDKVRVPWHICSSVCVHTGVRKS